MKVWVLECWFSEDSCNSPESWVEGVYSSLEKAENAFHAKYKVKRDALDYHIYEAEIDGECDTAD